MTTRILLTAALLLFGTSQAQGAVKAPAAPSVNFDVLPEGAVWVRPGVFKVPNYNGTGATLWIEVSGKSVPLFGTWTGLSGFQPVTINATPQPTATAASTTEPAATQVAAPTPKVEPVAAPTPKVEPVAAPTPKVEPVAAPTPKVEPVAAPTPKVEPVAAPAPKVEPVAAPAPTGSVTASSKAPGTTEAATRPLPATSPVRVALTASDKGTVTSSLPAWVSSQFFIAPGKADGTLVIGYSMNNSDPMLALITDPGKLRIKQGDRELTGRLDRRNTSQQVGYLGPKTGEFGTLTVQDASPEPITLLWEMQGTAGEGTYTVSVTWNVTQRTLRGS